MRLRITNTNFSTKHDWIFLLADECHNEFYIMNEAFYRRHNYKSPITKKELDYYDRGQWVNALVVQIDGKGIVISILR